MSSPLAMNAAAVSCVVLNYNGGDKIISAVESLMQAGCQEQQVIVVDNNSSDGSPDEVKNHFQKVRILENKTNVGYAGGMNIGVSACSEQYVLLCTGDIRVHQQCVRELVESMQSDNGAAIIGGRLLDEKGRWIFDAGRMVPFFYSIRRPCKETTQVDWVNGALMLVRRDDFMRLGGFDKTYFMYSEDVDICWRARKAGFRVLLNPKALAFHLKSYSSQHLDRASRQKLRMIQDINRFRTFAKNAGPSELVASIVWLQLTLAPRWTLSKFRGNDPSPSVRAYVWCARRLLRLLDVRKKSNYPLNAS